MNVQSSALCLDSRQKSVRIKNTHLIGRPDACLLIISDFRAFAEVFDVLVNACDVELDVAELFRIAIVNV